MVFRPFVKMAKQHSIAGKKKKIIKETTMIVNKMIAMTTKGPTEMTIEEMVATVKKMMTTIEMIAIIKKTITMMTS